MIHPFILRRLKKDVLDLPEKSEEVISIQLEGEQRKVYDAYAERLRLYLENKSDAEFKESKLEILAELTKLRQICCGPGLILDKFKGSNAKMEACMKFVEAFDKDEVPVFIISLKAGGTGLNLTAADIVIHYDPWWNVAAQNQATDRAHRIGQNNNVTVFKLVAEKTIEEQIVKLQDTKAQLAEDILSGEEVSTTTFNKEELLALL